MMGSITPDLVEWIVSDDKVVGHWRSIARRLGFSRSIPDLEIGRRHHRTSFNRNRGERHKLQALFRLWEHQRPDLYTIKELKNVLAAEGLHDMWMWVNMMTQTSTLKEQVSDVIYRNISSPPSTPSRSTYSPNSLHLYSPQVTPGPLYSPWTPSPQPGAPGTSRSTPRPPNSPLTSREGLGGQITSPRSTTSTSSPYSTFFQRMDSPDESTTSSIYISSLDSSRPNSQMSDYYSIGDYMSPGSRKGRSCPNTPILSRRSCSPSLTSPGWIRPSQTSGWIRSCPRSKAERCESGDKKNIYNLLYRPDLIKLSSPMQRFSRNGGAFTDKSEYETDDDKSVSPKMYVSHKTWLVERNIAELDAKKSHVSNENKPSHENLGNNMAETRKARENAQTNKNAEGRETANQHHSLKYRTSDTNYQQQYNTTQTTAIKNMSQKYENSITFNIERRKKVELPSVDITESPRKYGESSYSDYFDNLIALIDEAAKELSL